MKRWRICTLSELGIYTSIKEHLRFSQLLEKRWIRYYRVAQSEYIYRPDQSIKLLQPNTFSPQVTISTRRIAVR